MADTADTGGIPNVDDRDRLLAEDANPAQGADDGGGTDASGTGPLRINVADPGTDAPDAPRGEGNGPTRAGAAGGGYGNPGAGS